jgi:hypothetical protein
MYRHIPKLVVLSAIGLIILVIYSTQSRGPAAPAAPNVVYVNPNFGSQTLNAKPPNRPVSGCRRFADFGQQAIFKGRGNHGGQRRPTSQL